MHERKYLEYRISSNRMRALYLFQCFDSAHIIQEHFVFEGTLYFLPCEILYWKFTKLAMKFRTGSRKTKYGRLSWHLQDQHAMLIYLKDKYL